jgi:hypothetical protein
MEDKVLEVDLNNLTKDDFLEMAKYIAHLEANIEALKTQNIALVQQRANAEKRFRSMVVNSTVKSTPVQATLKLNDDVSLVNPEQYKIKKQF